MTAAESTGDQDAPAAPPDNPDALVEEINRTREELGNTVEALAAKVDVKARAQQKASEVSGELKTKARDITQGLSGKAGQLKGEVSSRSAGATAHSFGATAWAATPEPVQQRARRVAATVDQHRVPAAAATAAGALLLGGWLIFRGRRH